MHLTLGDETPAMLVECAGRPRTSRPFRWHRWLVGATRSPKNSMS